MSDKVPIDHRRAALKEIDDAKFGWYHIRACLVSGVGFFTDAYDIFAINLASNMLAFVYYPILAGGKPNNTGTLPAQIGTGIKVTVAIGTLIGQLVFGWLADLVGRKKMYGVELIIIIGSAAASATVGNGAAGVSVVGTLMFWRTLMGIGIGGDYPLSAIITSEFATKKHRGAMMAAVFAMQGLGTLAAAILSLILVVGFKDAILTDVNQVDYVWRLLLGLGAVPGVFALYFRLTIPETPRYTLDVEKNLNKATNDITAYLGETRHDNDIVVDEVAAPKATWSDFLKYFGKWKNGKILLGTAMTWFCLDVAFYGIGLNNTIILGDIGFSVKKGVKYATYQEYAFHTLYYNSIGNVILSLLGSVPGYWFTVFLVDRWGRKPIQLMGFAINTVLFFILGGLYTTLQKSNGLFIVLFTLSQFFFNFGPNATTFIVPGEVFPTRYRSTGHGISAASGKLGAIIAIVGFGTLANIGGPGVFVGKLFIIFAVWMILGFLFTLLLPETKGLTLEELSNEEPRSNEEKMIGQRSEGNRIISE